MSKPDIESFTTTARKPGTNVLEQGKKESYYRAQAQELYERGLTCSQILKRIFNINSVDDEISVGKDYYEQPSPSQLSPYEKNRRMRQTRLIWLVNALKIKVDDETKE